MGKQVAQDQEQERDQRLELLEAALRQISEQVASLVSTQNALIAKIQSGAGNRDKDAGPASGITSDLLLNAVKLVSEIQEKNNKSQIALVQAVGEREERARENESKRYLRQIKDLEKEADELAGDLDGKTGTEEKAVEKVAALLDKMVDTLGPVATQILRDRFLGGKQK